MKAFSLVKYEPVFANKITFIYYIEILTTNSFNLYLISSSESRKYFFVEYTQRDDAPEFRAEKL